MLTSKKNLLATLMATMIVLSIIMSAYPVSAKKNNIDVYPGGSIQDAINTALPGATIIVHAGTYSQGQIFVNQTVTLLGKDATIEYTLQPVFTGVQGTIMVLADDVRISGFTILAISTSTARGIDAAINVGNFPTPLISGCEIDNNIIISPAWGVAGLGTTGLVITNNVISARNPIWVTNAIDITIKNNELTAKTYSSSPVYTPPDSIANAVSAIKVAGASSGVLIKGNQINSEAYGIQVISAFSGAPSNIEISGNHIFTAFDGIYSDKGSNFTVKNNVVNAQHYGIWLKDMQGTEPKIAGNHVTSALTMTNKNKIDVYPGGSIQDAINTALSGTTIFVNEGTYNQGQIKINQTVTLLGKDATIEYTLQPVFSGVQAVITVVANDSRISGFTIHAIPTGTARGSDSAIEVGGFPTITTARCEIDNNVIDSPAWGVSGFGTTNLTVRNNVISSRNPIWVTNAVGITVKNNEFTSRTDASSPVYNPPDSIGNAVSAIKVAGASSGVLIKGNQINSEKYGIQVISGFSGVPSNIEIVGNHIFTSFDGIYSDKGSIFTVKNNVVNAQHYGIWLNDMQGTTAIVKDNFVTSGSTPIYVGNAA